MVLVLLANLELFAAPAKVVVKLVAACEIGFAASANRSF